jgi:hypothetical protein
MKTLLSVALALTLGAAVADATTVCVRKNGRLVLRPACRTGERTFDPTGFAIAGPEGPAGPQGPAGTTATFPLRLVDAIDQEVGEIYQLHPSGFARVAITRPPLQEPVLFFVTAKGFTSEMPGQPAVWYAGPGCAGAPYIREGYGQLAQLPWAQVSGTVAHYSSALPADLEMQSHETDFGGVQCPAGFTATPRATCCQDSTATVQSIKPASRVELVSLGLRPPFRAVKAQEGSE